MYYGCGPGLEASKAIAGPKSLSIRRHCFAGKQLSYLLLFLSSSRALLSVPTEGKIILKYVLTLNINPSVESTQFDATSSSSALPGSSLFFSHATVHSILDHFSTHVQAIKRNYISHFALVVFARLRLLNEREIIPLFSPLRSSLHNFFFLVFLISSPTRVNERKLITRVSYQAKLIINQT